MPAVKTTWKLTPEQRLIILERYRSGELLKLIASDYGVTEVAIGQIAHRAGEPRRKLRLLQEQEIS